VAYVNEAIAIRDVVDASTRLWLVDLGVAPDAAQCKWLSFRELDRALHFRHEKDRRRYLAAHCALRLLIEDFAKVKADRIEFVVGPWGKPAVSGLANVHFSVSYTEDRALIGLSSAAEIGVDVEMVREIEDADALAQDYFTQSERNALSMTVQGGSRQQSFLRGWTRKEACIKAVGFGLYIHPASFTSGVSDERLISALPLPNGLAFVDVVTVPLGPEIIGACSLTFNTTEPDRVCAKSGGLPAS
jgi:4'-phosphopantetheinyl transferase